MGQHTAMHPVIRVPRHPPPLRTQWQGYTDRKLSGNHLVITVQVRKRVHAICKLETFKHAQSQTCHRLPLWKGDMLTKIPGASHKKTPSAAHNESQVNKTAKSPRAMKCETLIKI